MRSDYYDEDDENYSGDFDMEDNFDLEGDFDESLTIQEDKVNYEPFLGKLNHLEEDFNDFDDEIISKKFKRRLILDSIKLNSQSLWWNLLSINTKLNLIENTYSKLINLIKNN